MGPIEKRFKKILKNFFQSSKRSSTQDIAAATLGKPMVLVKSKRL